MTGQHVPGSWIFSEKDINDWDLVGRSRWNPRSNGISIMTTFFISDSIKFIVKGSILAIAFNRFDASSRPVYEYARYPAIWRINKLVVSLMSRHAATSRHSAHGIHCSTGLLLSVN